MVKSENIRMVFLKRRIQWKRDDLKIYDEQTKFDEKILY
jgi:hypothetical protein